VTNRHYEKDVLLPTIGRLVAIYWDTDIVNGVYETREIPLRACNEKDFSEFYMPHKVN